MSERANRLFTGTPEPGALLRALHAHASAAPLRPALHSLGYTIGYGKLWRRVERVCAHLAGTWGVQPGDRVATLCLNHDLQLAMLFACARLGAIFVPLNFRLAVPELSAIAAHAGIRVLFHDAPHAQAAAAVAAALPEPAAQAPIDSLIDRPAPLDTPLPRPSQPPDEAPLLLVYTSGSTGHPKGALHTQASLLANARASWWAHGMTRDDHI
ncbi:AMP-binding protein, partial [Cupriavidus sp. CV2]|uniref:AMP-binding protein n=1 Tax=Cupriavidus ulmosensis TaxID=3065913 RepID=UPI00296ADA64